MEPMNNISKEDDTTASSKSKFSSSCKVFSCTILFFVLFFVIMVLFLTSLLFILLEFNVIQFINPNHILVPEDHALYDLNIFTYKDRTMYKYDGHLIVLPIAGMTDGEDDESIFEPISSNGESEDSGVVVMTVTPLSNIEYRTSCSGTCKCYMDENEMNYNDDENDRRWGSSLVFSKRYTSVVVVTMLGYAVAKFVNDHLDDCYHMARETLGYDNTYSLICTIAEKEGGGGVSDEGLTTPVGKGDAECTPKEPIEGSGANVKDMDKVEEQRKHVVLNKPQSKRTPGKSECNGYCVTRNDLRNSEAALAAKCEDYFAGPHVVTQFDFGIPPHVIYRRQFLVPFCHAIRVDIVDEDQKTFEICPCLGNRSDKKNIKCRGLPDA